MNDPLARLFRYNAWANRKLIDRCRVLPDAALDARAPGAFGSVRETLLHIADGQRAFVARAKGEAAWLPPTDVWPGFGAFAEAIAASDAALLDLAEGLDVEREVTLTYQGESWRFPVSFFLAHAVAHGVEHRSQVSMTLAAAGGPGMDLDGWGFALETGIGAAGGPG